MYSDLTQNIQDSLTLAISARAKALASEGERVINTSIGEPDFDTPAYIKQGAENAMRDGRTKYTPVAGILELKEAVCQKYAHFNKMHITPDQVVISTGAKQALINAFFSLVNPGDEVLIPVPYWLSYPEMVKLVHGVAVPVKSAPGEKLVDALSRCVTPRTKVLVLNNPNNPSGQVYNKKDLETIGQFCIAHNLHMIADEIYERLTYDAPFVSLAALSPDFAARTVTISGFSKSYAMTGWRLGYSVAPRELSQAMSRIQAHMTSNASSISQYAGLAALQKEDESIDQMIRTFAHRRRVMAEQLKKQGLMHAPLQGAFYAFIDISPYIGCSFAGQKLKGSVDFCRVFLESERVAAVPGIVFGDDHAIRLSYAISEDDIIAAVTALGRFVHKLQSSK